MNTSILTKISCHGLDFGIGAACASVEGAALYAAKRIEPKNPVDKAIKYSLIALAALAAIGATLAGSVAMGGVLVSCFGLKAAEWGVLSTALLSLFGHVQAFRVATQEKIAAA